MTKTEPEYLTPEQVSARWDNAITPGTLANWRARKQGPPFQKFGTRVRYPVSGLAAWEAKHRQAPEADNDNNVDGAKGAA